MERKLLILGFDPGTTVGYALLDLEGNLIKANSTKEHTFSSLLLEITNYGRIIIVAADKHKSPHAAAKIASSIGAKLILPNKDLSADEKRILAKDYSVKNIHESDALAAALHAYKNLKPRLQKIEFFIEKYEQGKIIERIKETLIKDENSSFQKAKEILDLEQNTSISPIINFANQNNNSFSNNTLSSLNSNSNNFSNNLLSS